jgi:hypothetical protein
MSKMTTHRSGLVHHAIAAACIYRSNTPTALPGPESSRRSAASVSLLPPGRNDQWPLQGRDDPSARAKASFESRATVLRHPQRRSGGGKA